MSSVSQPAAADQAGGTTCVVAVCAYTMKRWDQLETGVREALVQRRPGDEVVVIIDHNRELFERATAELVPAGAIVVENAHKQGLSGGRNTAIEHPSACDVIVYLDDDATPEPGWLDALRAPYRDPQVIAVGGVAVPIWPEGQGRPETLPAARTTRGEYDWVVGCTYAGQPVRATPVRNLMGCNMSFRRDRLVRLGGFDENMGRVGTVPLGCEETEICIRATQAEPGAVVLFEPKAVVRHHVSADRLTWKYFASRCRAEGVSKAYVSQRVTQSAGLASEAAYTRSILPKGFVREMRAGHVRSAAAIVAGLAMAGYGYAEGGIALRRGRRSA